MLVDLLLRELYVCTAMGFEVPKPYLLALCRTVAALDVFPVGEAEGAVSDMAGSLMASLGGSGQPGLRKLRFAARWQCMAWSCLRLFQTCPTSSNATACAVQLTARRLLELARQLLTEVPDSSMRKDLKVGREVWQEVASCGGVSPLLN